MGWNWQRPGNRGMFAQLGVFVAGLAVGIGVFLPLSRRRCLRRYRRLCGSWFAGDPAGYDGCIARADDVCSW